MTGVLHSALPPAFTKLHFYHRPLPPLLLSPRSTSKLHSSPRHFAFSSFQQSCTRTHLLSTRRPRRIRAIMASSASSPAKPFSVLFVCLGNICRSPAAEGVFKGIVKEKGMDSRFMIDSAGTIDYHEGNPADPRMKAAARKRGMEITSISRPIKPSDFVEFDLILAMDKQNKADILDAFERWQEKASLPPDAHKKVKLMCSYCKRHGEIEVPDPYYGGPQGFEQVLDLLEDACESLYHSILVEK